MMLLAARWCCAADTSWVLHVGLTAVARLLSILTSRAPAALARALLAVGQL